MRIKWSATCFLTLLFCGLIYGQPAGADFGSIQLVVDPHTPMTLYAASSGLLSKSTDGGATWTVTSLPAGPSQYPWAVAIDRSTPSSLYAGVGDLVFKSTDSGASWTSSLLALGDIAIALAIDPTAPSTLYAGTNFSGVRKSTNGGASWSATGLPNEFVNTVVIAPITPSTLYAGTEYDTAAVSKSTDAGATWHPSAAGLSTGGTYSTINVMAIDPLSPSTLYAGGHTDFGVKPHSAEHVLFKSTDAGGSWSTIETGIGISRGGNTDVARLLVDPVTPTTVYAIVAAGGDRSYNSRVYKSTDAGGHWKRSSKGIKRPAFPDQLAIDPTVPTTLYVRAGGAVFKSTDGGKHWFAGGLLP